MVIIGTSCSEGPVVIDIPVNLQRNDCEYLASDPAIFAASYRQECHLSDDQCAVFFKLLEGSSRPLLYLGGGLTSSEATEAVRAFRSRFRIPAVNTLMGKGVVDERDDDVLGLLGMFGTPAANTIIQENDLFIALAVRWDDRVAEKVGFALKSKIAYIDINPEKVRQIRLERNPEFSVSGSVAHILRDLLSYAERKGVSFNRSEWSLRARTLKKAWPLDWDRANPGRMVVVVDGDGSLRMNMGELYTIGTYGLNVKVLLLNNMSDGMVRNLETAAYGNRHSATERSVDVSFADMARVCGFAYSRRVAEKAELDAALGEFLSTPGAAMLEVMTDIEEILYPVVPVGKGYHEMNLGPFIRQVEAE